MTQIPDSAAEVAKLVERLRRLSTIEFGGYAAGMAVQAMDEAADALSALSQSDRELREAAQAVIEQWDTPNWKLDQPTADLINRLRAALTKDAV